MNCSIRLDTQGHGWTHVNLAKVSSKTLVKYNYKPAALCRNNSWIL